MKRRQLINQIALASASYPLLNACNNATEYNTENETATNDVQNPLIQWRCATSWSKQLTATVYGGVEDLCNQISEITAGRFQITPFPEGEIVPGLNVFEAVSDSTVECGHTSSAYYVSQNPAFTFATSLPFGFNAKQQMAWLSIPTTQELIRKIYAKYNVINFPAGNSTNQMGGWFKKKVNSVQDLKGLKIRLTGLGGEILKRLGAEVVTIPGSKIVSAFESNELDAAEWTGPYDDEQFGFPKVAPYYYYPAWHQPGPCYDFIVNLDEWNKLPPSYQQAIATASTLAYGNIIARYDVENMKALQDLIKGGTKLEAYNPEILKAAQKVAFEIYEENAASSDDFKEIYQKWQTFREEIYAWSKISDISYQNFAFNNI